MNGHNQTQLQYKINFRIKQGGELDLPSARVSLNQPEGYRIAISDGGITTPSGLVVRAEVCIKFNGFIVMPI